MHPLAKRIALLISGFCLVLGLFLLGYNIHLISQDTMRVALNLWPLALIVVGMLLVADSLKKRGSTRRSKTQSKDYALPVSAEAREILFKVYFSYGTLTLGGQRGEPALHVEQIGPMGDPSIQSELRGSTSHLTLTISQPIFPSYFQLLNRWHLDLPRTLPVRLDLHLHEANLLMDLHGLAVETLDMRADAGIHEIRLGSPPKKLTGQIYSSSSELRLMLPMRTYVRVFLKNPFCRVDYPQGDLERREDGSFVSAALRGEGLSNLEIAIDGPIKNLVLDVEDQNARQ
jgi:hypothetical protein